ncbi:hypothetical protein [Nocardia sp. NPDC051832]|uniref:alpha/beta hydrolase family protein n=1 Tax=Nocardia sp. NPDC051832 TaxID=3155673 RepID=UPI0034164983
MPDDAALSTVAVGGIGVVLALGGMLIGRMTLVTLSAAALVAGSVVSSGAAHASVLPRPGGEFAVGTTVLRLADQARPDPFRPERTRELMVSVFYPAVDADKHPQAHYVSTSLLPELEKRAGVQLPGLLTNAHTEAPARTGESYPVVLFSPGAGVMRLWSNGLAEDLASRGYVVVTIDHTYETAVEFPGGRIVEPKLFPEFSQEVRRQYLDARMADTRLVLDSMVQLAHGTNPDADRHALPAGLDRVLDLERIGMAGHSLGGYVAVESMHADRRIDAAVDLDGQIGIDEDFGRSVIEGVDRPVLVMTSEQIEQVGDANPSLEAFWQRGTGWKRQLTMQGSAHYDFTDMPVLIPDAARPAAKTYVGPIAAERSSTLVRTYVAAMFDQFLRDRPTPILNHPTHQEITALR